MGCDSMAVEKIGDELDQLEIRLMAGRIKSDQFFDQL
jgi:hypothetical protein